MKCSLDNRRAFYFSERVINEKNICLILIAVFVSVLGTSTYFIIDHYKEGDGVVIICVLGTSRKALSALACGSPAARHKNVTSWARVQLVL